MKNLKTFEEHNEKDQLKVKYTKQTMDLDIDWKAAKDFDIYYSYKTTRDVPVKNDENGWNYYDDGHSIDTTSVFRYMNKYRTDEMKKYSQKYGGSPRPAFIVKKGTHIKITHPKGSYYDLMVEIIEGEHNGKSFKAYFPDFRPCVTGEAKDANLTVSKYKIFLNGKEFKSKYYTTLGSIKSALMIAFGLFGDESPVNQEISLTHFLDRDDCKNAEIMQYDNDSKVGTPVKFNVLDFYDECMMKKDSKKYNL